MSRMFTDEIAKVGSRRHLLEDSRGAPDARLTMQRRLAYFNRNRLSPAYIGASSAEDSGADLAMARLEGEFLESVRHEIVERARTAPMDTRRFLKWFEDLRHVGPGQGHPLFPWLADEATEQQMRWFLSQEIAGEAGFDDLVAMTQVKLPARAKLEMARNYWDEMGQGNALAMHGALLERLAVYFNLTPSIDESIAESLALGNTMVGLAINRRYVFQSIGALGVIELTAPGRAVYVAEGLRRLGVPAKARNYFALHATLDVRHSRAWNDEVIASLVEGDERAAAGIAEGALMRLACGAACFTRYAEEFGIA